MLRDVVMCLPVVLFCNCWPYTVAFDHYQVTLALDSQALCCASGVAEILDEGPGEFDIAFAVQVGMQLVPSAWPAAGLILVARAVLLKYSGGSTLTAVPGWG